MVSMLKRGELLLNEDIRGFNKRRDLTISGDKIGDVMDIFNE
jgi:hypothetical protein